MKRETTILARTSSDGEFPRRFARLLLREGGQGLSTWVHCVLPASSGVIGTGVAPAFKSSEKDSSPKMGCCFFVPVSRVTYWCHCECDMIEK